MGRSELIERLRQTRQLLFAARPVHWAATADLEAARAWQRDATILLELDGSPPVPPDAA